MSLEQGAGCAPPAPAELREAAAAILAALSPRKIFYLTERGAPAEGPRTLRDRISHALLHELKSRGEKDGAEAVARAGGNLATPEAWPAISRLVRSTGCGKDGPANFLAVHEALCRIIEREAFRLNAEAPAPDWSGEARAAKAEYRRKLAAFDESEAAILRGDESRRFLEASRRILDDPSSPVPEIARLVAEQEKITASLERLLAEAASRAQREEVYAAITEKIQPPMGIVTHLSPALFFPCLRLLHDPRIEVSSGVPYMASVDLGIFRDPRSADVLLESLDRFPLGLTKIRENIIFTLGNLREERAAPALARVLEAPDEIVERAGPGQTCCLLLEQKEEAIWALGKIGLASLDAVPGLIRYADHPSSRLKTYLAWTLGEVGRAQKEATGGVSADIVIALLKLLKEKNRQVFEEAVGALKKIDMPEFVHSLYLYHVGAVSILGLKPAQRGLNELSETLHYLLRTKKRTVMAVNGDSGTGKTYFCEAIAGGFGDIRPHEILYLMRDTRRGQKVFNRLLGLRWLRKHIDPAYYQDYPVGEDKDDPEAYFTEFLEENADKRLIILDGCRDRHYFQKVIDFFYARGELDVEVNFRANFSTRRLNLEERENAVESVRMHLAFLEEPAIEDTSFYQEGLVILYDLDNSKAARLDAQETREVFDARRIDDWGELIRIGGFAGRPQTADCGKEALEVREGAFETAEEDWPEWRARPFTPGERKLKPVLNDDLGREPNLLKCIPLEGLDARQLRFYAQDQVAGMSAGGEAFVLTLLDNRIFCAPVGPFEDFALLGRTFYAARTGGGLLSLSLERDEVAETPAAGVKSVRIASFPPDRIVTAQADGRIRVWDFLEKTSWSFAARLGTITALAVDPKGKVYAAGSRGDLVRWDLEARRRRAFAGRGGAVRFVRPYPGGRMLAVEEAADQTGSQYLRLFDPEKGEVQTTSLPPGRRASGVNVYYDGRVVASFAQAAGSRASLLIISPRPDGCSYVALSGHAGGTHDCLAIGPKIITCGREADGGAAARVWGSELFVRTELGKLFIKPQ